MEKKSVLGELHKISNTLERFQHFLKEQHIDISISDFLVFESDLHSFRNSFISLCQNFPSFKNDLSQQSEVKIHSNEAAIIPSSDIDTDEKNLQEAIKESLRIQKLEQSRIENSSLDQNNGSSGEEPCSFRSKRKRKRTQIIQSSDSDEPLTKNILPRKTEVPKTPWQIILSSDDENCNGNDIIDIVSSQEISQIPKTISDQPKEITISQPTDQDVVEYGIDNLRSNNAKEDNRDIDELFESEPGPSGHNASLDDIYGPLEESRRIQSTLVTKETEDCPEDAAELLKKTFGFKEFRRHQWRIINNVLDKKDQLIVMATGYGKSICFQFPSIYKGGLTLCVSPLISLMRDQVYKLQTMNIEADFLGTQQTAKVRAMRNICSGKTKIVYVTPEYCINNINILIDIHQKARIICFAIDEAHCVSQWGHDFREEYGQLGKLRQIDSSIPFLAMTATATADVRDDISKSLGLVNPFTKITSFDRENVYLCVRKKSKSILNDIKQLPIVEDNLTRIESKPYFIGSTIIYCHSVKLTEEVYQALLGEGFKIGIYHGQMNAKDRDDTHRSFLADKLNVIVATCAFGMGVDKPNVRYVIHYGAPRSPESYYQEIGRAGRDGIQSCAFTFWAESDFKIINFFVGSLQNSEYRSRQRLLVSTVREFLTLIFPNCRRAKLLKHFGQYKERDVRKCCDLCSGDKQVSTSVPSVSSKTGNFGKFSRILFGAIQDHGAK